MTEIRTNSHKPKLGQEWSYPLAVGDIEAALRPLQTRDLFLSVDFHPNQDWRKEERDRLQALGEYLLVSCQFSSEEPRWPVVARPDLAWIQEHGAQVVRVGINAVPTTALIHGVSLRGYVGRLLSDGLAALAPRGLPTAPLLKDGWILDVRLDSRLHTLQADLRPWNGVEYRVARQLSSTLPPVEESKRV